jgi:hypothetical protein
MSGDDVRWLILPLSYYFWLDLQLAEMKKTLLASFVALSFLISASTTKPDEWTNLLDKDLTQWDSYLSFRHKDNYNGKIPKDAAGNDMRPIGYNKDETGVFTIKEEQGKPVLRVSGEIYGCLISKKTYKNYHLKWQVKWGTEKYEPRKDKLRDTGILYHSIGEAGAEWWRTWMLSQEFQIMEGHTGDYWKQASSCIDVRAYQSEGVMNCVADEKAPFRTIGLGNDINCIRSANFENGAGQWDTLELICFEGKSLHIVNGHVVMVLQNSRYVQPDGKIVTLDSGKIQLQSEAAEAFFRDVQIRPIKALPAAYTRLF